MIELSLPKKLAIVAILVATYSFTFEALFGFPDPVVTMGFAAIVILPNLLLSHVLIHRTDLFGSETNEER
ncbi:hypothetical protein RBH26_14590 [Natronolimnohabitans sp. A-GB9]|uniref:hypothetical protein n=1 Tax=Natronolimnohabitans sp. A-GB9 TaxID=3069757 RepID=UPI0027B15AD5|nr:hypothetical protein [Natronolimnohabitans sp. A-GB9]MDQ2051704.1 hypothetical protein [Natronolimnohabitans sp. A-GB9]